MKACRRITLWSALFLTNGPVPSAVLQIAIAAMREVASAAPAARKRIAAQMMKGKTTKASTSSRLASPVRQKMLKHVPSSPIERANSSSERERFGHRGNELHVNSNGITMTTPMASPSHQTLHAGPNPDQAGVCERKRTVVPTEAATIGLRAAAATTPKTSLSLENERSTFVRRTR